MPPLAAVISAIKNHQQGLCPVVPFNPQTDKLLMLDFTQNNKELTDTDIADTEKFAAYINTQLKKHGSTYGIGGYGEHRTLYARSKHFDPVHKEMEEPRRLHLGTDIWGAAGTRVMAPI